MKKRMDLRLFDLDANLIDRSGAESLIRSSMQGRSSRGLYQNRQY